VVPTISEAGPILLHPSAETVRPRLNIYMSASLFLLSLPITRTPVPVAAPDLTWGEIARRAHYRPHGVAALCCVSFRTVQRHFRKRYQTTFTAWLEEHRMNEARCWILEGRSLKEVCFDLGYKQQSHFTRVFKKHFGVPPSLLSAHHLPLHTTVR
jgi:AraC-like DNA-binding protein